MARAGAILGWALFAASVACSPRGAVAQETLSVQIGSVLIDRVYIGYDTCYLVRRGGIEGVALSCLGGHR